VIQVCRTIKIDPAEAARALRAIPSDRRSEASRLNGRRNRPGHGGRPRFKTDTYRMVFSGAVAVPEAEPGGTVATFDDAEAVARTVLTPGDALTIYRGNSTSPSARWEADSAGRVLRVRTF